MNASFDSVGSCEFVEVLGRVYHRDGALLENPTVAYNVPGPSLTIEFQPGAARGIFYAGGRK
jgi:hypothetical protein